MEGKFLFLVIVTLFGASRCIDDDCVWPKNFDLSKVRTSWRYGDQDRSWDTRIQIETSVISEVNGHIKGRNRVLIMSNSTFQIIQELEGQMRYLRGYKCHAVINSENLFIIKTAPIKEVPQDNSASSNIFQTRYRCMALTFRTRHVFQWKLGDLQDSPPDDCSSGFTDSENNYVWPLVYFPVEDTDEDRDLARHLEYLDEYPKCPDLNTKGYLMEVKGPDGSDVCSNANPSPRLEVACSNGGGLRMLPSTSNQCQEYSFLGDMGAKMHCLGDWEDESHKYILLVPSGATKVRSFHCLRLNKEDPTTKDAILFLDTSCNSTSLVDGNNFFRIRLQSKKIDGICDNYDKTCGDTDCNDRYPQYACFESCSCPVDGESSGKADDKLVGEWIVQTRISRETIKIASDAFDLGDLGKFKIYGEPNDTQCMKPPAILDDGMSYVLASTDEIGSGCLPRVTQLSIKKIAESVALMQVLEPSPLRANGYAAKPSSWCLNNLEEVKAFSPIYHPYWPYVSDNPHGKGSGWFTLIKSDETSSSCGLNTPQFDYTAVSNIKLEFLSQSNKRYKCDGKAHNDGDNKYIIDYQKCMGNMSYGASIDFECYGSYKFNDQYQAVIGKIPSVVKFPGENKLLLREEYYCMLFPSKTDMNTLPVLVYTAGDCDAPNIAYVEEHYRKPVIKMTYIPVIDGANSINNNTKILFACLFAITFLLKRDNL